MVEKQLPTLDELKKSVKRPKREEIREKPILETRRGRETNEEKEERLLIRDEVLDDLEKSELIDILFDENRDIDFEELLKREVERTGGKGSGKTSTRTNQPLRRVRESMEDVFTTLRLRDLIEDFRDARVKRKKGEDTYDEEDQDVNMMMNMLPFIKKMQNGGIDTSKIDPNWLWLLIAGQGRGNQNLNQLMMMMTLMNTMAQGSNDVQGGGGGSNINAEMIKTLYNEFQNIMRQQQQPQIDPTTAMMLSIMQKNMQNPQVNRDTSILLDKFNQMITNNQTSQMRDMLDAVNIRFERSLERIAGALDREPPMSKFMQGVEFTKSMLGDQRARTRDELEYDLKRQEITLKQQERLDMLDREEREKVREETKSDRIIEGATTVIDKILGKGLGDAVGNLITARVQGGKKRGGKSPIQETEFDASYLDEL